MMVSFSILNIKVFIAIDADCVHHSQSYNQCKVLIFSLMRDDFRVTDLFLCVWLGLDSKPKVFRSIIIFPLSNSQDDNASTMQDPAIRKLNT